VLGAEGRAILDRYGFLLPSGALEGAAAGLASPDPPRSPPLVDGSR
jgi:hypothetical protein